MKRFHLFAANAYDDEIGMLAYKGAFETLDEARAAHTTEDTAHVAEADAKTGELKIVSELQWNRERFYSEWPVEAKQ